MRNTLKFMKMTSTTERVIRNNCYDVREIGGWRGVIARLAWRFLWRHSAALPHYGEHEVWSYTPAKQDRVSAEIAYALDEVVFNGEGAPNDYCIVMGGKTFHDLMGEAPWAIGTLTLPAADRNYVRSGYRGVLQGMPIHVVSHLEGHAILPKVIIEKAVQRKSSATDPLKALKP